MTRYFVSRHAGARRWLEWQGVVIDFHVTHLTDLELKPGDTVTGTLPLHLACWVCEQGAEYWHLRLDIPAQWRGQELSPEQMEACGARLEAFTVHRVATTGALENS